MNKSKNKYYLYSFLLGFAVFLLIIVSDIIANKGIYLYYGDYNDQQAIFPFLMYDAVHGQGVNLWDWKTGLGIQFGGAYAYYNLYSPFTWITWIFPRDWLIYEQWILLGAKFGVASLTSYAYISRYLKRTETALIGAMLYAFSSFQMYNLVFHFHDAVAFFPLLLLSFDDAVEGKRRGFFALMVFLSAIVNYYFFFGEVIFVLLYFIVRCITRDYKLSLKMFLNVLFQAVVGLGMSSLILIPALLMLVGNSKAGGLISDNLLVYDNLWRYLKIIQSMFIVPDEFSYANLFLDYESYYPFGSINSSVALYLPLFGMVGVIAYIFNNKKTWQSILLYVSFVFAFIPVLNSSFSAFNSNYYTRWYFMPILIMSMMSAYVLENSEKISIKRGLIISLVVIASMFIFMLLFNLEKAAQWTVIHYDRVYIIISFIIALVSLLLLYLLFYKTKRDKEYWGKAVLITLVGVFMTGGFMFTYFSVSFPDKLEIIKKYHFNEANPLEIPQDHFYRTSSLIHNDNFSMLWKYNSISVFHSIYEPSSYEFYDFIGKYSGQRIDSFEFKNDYALASLTSTKYFFSSSQMPDNSAFKLLKRVAGYYVYENTAFIPMGYTYDEYITKEELSKIDIEDRTKVMLKAICVESELPPEVGISEIMADELTSFSDEMYLFDCTERNKETCSEFNTNSHGFDAEINLSKGNLVFFSIPYNKGFTAYVDHCKTDIIKVNSGLCAVYVPEGNHEIVFDYFPVGMKAGIIISISSFSLLVGYILLGLRKKQMNHE